MVQIRRVYDADGFDSGKRFLIDRIWPRGLRKEALKLDGWVKEVAPSSELRKWFGHDPEKWTQFQKRYRAELDEHPSGWETLLENARGGDITLLYGARDEQHNNAVVLKDFLEAHLKVKSPQKKSKTIKKD